MSILTSRSGDELLLFLAGEEPTPLADYPDLPLMFSCVVARYKGGVLYVFNAWRKEWELPSGMIEAGESHYDAAQRELEEESGQIASSLAYVGLCLLRSNGQLELGTIYTCELEEIRPFKTNDETSGMMLLWDVSQNQHINELGLKLAELAQPNAPSL
jgi:8-oxo-dGTP diphosphatase